MAVTHLGAFAPVQCRPLLNVEAIAAERSLHLRPHLSALLGITQRQIKALREPDKGRQRTREPLAGDAQHLHAARRGSQSD